MSFNLEQWLIEVGIVIPSCGTYITGQPILGPHDAYTAVRIREILQPRIHFGVGIPTDLFILSTGEGPSRSSTKVGGLPFWPNHRKWPTSDNGKPRRFVAQFDFRSSIDIVGTMPGDLLLLFDTGNAQDGFFLEWEKVVPNLILIQHDDVSTSIAPSFHGTRWRTMNYPNWKSPTEEFQVELPNGTMVLDIPFVMELLGIQIGSSPLLPSWIEGIAKNERVICSLCSIFPKPNRPFPFLNRSVPLTPDEAENLSSSFSYREDDGFAVLYVIETPTGSFRYQLEEF